MTFPGNVLPHGMLWGGSRWWIAPGTGLVPFPATALACSASCLHWLPVTAVDMAPSTFYLDERMPGNLEVGLPAATPALRSERTPMPRQRISFHGAQFQLLTHSKSSRKMHYGVANPWKCA